MLRESYVDIKALFPSPPVSTPCLALSPRCFFQAISLFAPSCVDHSLLVVSAGGDKEKTLFLCSRRVPDICTVFVLVSRIDSVCIMQAAQVGATCMRFPCVVGCVDTVSSMLLCAIARGQNIMTYYL